MRENAERLEADASRAGSRSLSLALPALLLIAFALRLWQITRIPLWLDETALIMQAANPLPDIFHDVFFVHPTPPLYVLFMGFWVPLGPSGELWPRLPSAVFGALFVPSVAWMAGELGGRRAALIAGAFALLHPLALWYSQEARTYSLSMTLAALVGAAEVRFLRRGEGRWAAATAVLTVALELSHYAAVLPIGIASFLALAYPTRLGRRLLALAALWISAAPLAITREARDYLGAVTGSILPDSGGFNPSGASALVANLEEALPSVWDAWVRFVGGPAVGLFPALAAALAVSAVALSVAVVFLGPHSSRWIILGFFITCVVALLVPQTRTLLSERYASLTLGFLLAAGAAAVARVRPAWIRVAVAAVLALFLVTDAIYWLDPRVGKGPNYREPAYYLATRAQPGDVIVEADLDQTFDYYALHVFGAPVRIVRPRVGIGGESVEETGQDLTAALDEASAAWYMPRWTEAFWDPEQRVRTWLDANWCLANALRFDVVDLREYVPCPG